MVLRSTFRSYCPRRCERMRCCHCLYAWPLSFSWPSAGLRMPDCVKEILGAGIHAMVRAVAVKAVPSVGTKGLGVGRALQEWRQKRWVRGAERGGHHVDLPAVPKGPVRLVPAERVRVIFGHTTRGLKDKPCAWVSAPRERACCVGAGGENVYVTCPLEGIAWKRGQLTAGVLLVVTPRMPPTFPLPW